MNIVKNFPLYPWDFNEKPYFTNEEGFEWYYDKSTTQYATSDVYLYGDHIRKGLKNVMAFYVKRDDTFESVLINNKQEVLAVSKTSIGLCFEIDKIKIWEDFAVNEDRESRKERKEYINEVSEFISEDIQPLKLQSEPNNNTIFLI